MRRVLVCEEERIIYVSRYIEYGDILNIIMTGNRERERGNGDVNGIIKFRSDSILLKKFQFSFFFVSILLA